MVNLILQEIKHYITEFFSEINFFQKERKKSLKRMGSLKKL
jgi:hypothetical protein